MSDPKMSRARPPQPRTEGGKFAVAVPFTQAIVDELCERLEAGEAIKKICADAHMPDWRTLRRWKRKYPEFAAPVCSRAGGFRGSIRGGGAGGSRKGY